MSEEMPTSEFIRDFRLACKADFLKWWKFIGGTSVLGLLAAFYSVYQLGQTLARDEFKSILETHKEP